MSQERLRALALINMEHRSTEETDFEGRFDMFHWQDCHSILIFGDLADG